MSHNWRGYSRKPDLPSNWEKLRRQILKRDQHRCRWLERGVRCMQLAREVDHVVRGNGDHPSNLQALCTPHHRQKTQQEAYSARHLRKRPPEPHPGMIA